MPLALSRREEAAALADRVPAEIQREPRWILWDTRRGKDGRPTKVPLQADGRALASSTDPDTWTIFDVALSAFEEGRGDGLGFVLGDGWVGVDLDEVLDAGRLEIWASLVVERLASYTEFSPSGQGLHIICVGVWPETPKLNRVELGEHRKVEAYGHGRFFTVTGNRKAATPPTVEERSDELVSLHRDLADLKGFFSWAGRQRHSGKVRRLVAGDTSAHQGDDSAADLALVSLLAQYTEGAAGRIDRIFRLTRLVREKWSERQDYRERTIAKALEGLFPASTVSAEPTMPAGEARLKTLVPELDAWPYVGDYLAYARALTDAPDQFHVGVALMTLASAVGNSQWMEPFAGRRTYPNLWLLLISASGFYRKNTAIAIGDDLLSRAGLARSYPSQWTLERFLEILQDQPTGVMPAPEFGAFLGMMARDYNTGARELLTDFFDTRPLWERQTKGGGIVRIRWPAVSIMGATVIDWIMGKLKAPDLRGGFLARFLVIPATRKDRWQGLGAKPDTVLRNSLVAALQQVSRLEGEADLALIQPMFDAWVQEFESRPVLPDLYGLAARVPTYALKFALLLEAATLKPAGLILPESWDLGRRLAEVLYECTAEVMIEQVTEGWFQTNRKRVLGLIRTHRKGVLHSEALRASKLSKVQFETVISTLIEDETISVHAVPTTGQGGRPGKMYLVRQPGGAS